MSRQTIIQKGSGDDIFVYFHIEGTYIREQAVHATKDSVVSELWGNGTSAYRSVMAGYGGWAKYIAALAKSCGKTAFAHTCLTTWSAGSEILKTVCRGRDLPDAIVSLDGIYGSKPPGSRPGDGQLIADAGTDAIAEYALAAARGEKIFVLLHSAIQTPYGSSGECAARIRRYVEERMGEEMAIDADLTAAELGSHQFTDALVLGNFHMLEFPGRDGAEHVREAHLFDEVWKRWIPWATDGVATKTDPAPAPVEEPAELAQGARGAEVVAWQTFLVGQGAAISTDGVFGPRTEAATKTFQSEVSLPATGRVDGETLAAARGRGFGEPVGGPQHPVEEHGPEWPPRPSFPPLISQIDRASLFGSFRYEPAPTPGNPEGIHIVDGWAGVNIVSVSIPQLRGVVGAPSNCMVALHRLAAPKVQELFARWEQAGLLHLVKSWAGSWAPRFVRGSRSTLSNHAFGTAFDINASWNALGAVPALAGRTGSVRELVPLANELGFFWGGHYSTRPDGMHFELARL